MPYVLKASDGAYIKQTLSKYEFTRSFALATKWKKQEQAESQLRFINRINKYFSSKHLKVEQVGSAQAEDVAEKEEEAAVPDTSFCVVDKARDFVTYANKLVAKKTELLKQLSDVDREIVDIEHKIEFCKLSASEGYKIYKRLHDAANRRRRIKDDIFIVESLIPAVNTSQLDDVEKRLNTLDTRRYHPRIDSELFGIDESSSYKPGQQMV